MANERPPMRMMGRGGPPPHERMLMAEKPKNTKGTLKRLVGYIGKNRYLMILLLSVMLIITVLNLVAPYLQGLAIDKITVSNQRLNVDISGMLYCLIALGCVYLVNSLLTYFQGIFAAKLSQTTVKAMRKDLFDKISYLPIKYTDTHQHGDIMSRMTNDVENISNTVSQSIASLFSGVLTLVGCLVFMLYYSPMLTLVSLTSVVLTLVVTKNLTKFMRKYFPLQQTLLGRLNGHIEEMVSGYRTVAAYSKEKKACEEFGEISDELQKAAIKAQICGGIMGPCMNVISNISFLLVAGFGAYFLITLFPYTTLFRSDRKSVVKGKSVIGFSFGFNWKGLNFSAMLYSPRNIYKLQFDQYLWDFPASNIRVQPKSMERWTPETANSSGVMRPATHLNNTYNKVESTYRYSDYSYIRLKNMEIGYTFPKKWLSEAHISNLQVYMNGNNLLTFWKGDKRVDPETGGVGSYPIVRTYTLGLRVSF